MSRTVARVLGTAWAAPDRFDWFSEYLRIQGLQVLARLLVACTVALTSTIPSVMLLSPAGAQQTTSRVVAVVISVLGIAIATLWSTRAWPTSAQSVTFIVVTDVMITAGCAIDALPLAGLIGTTMFAALGGYAAFFHGARVLTAHIAGALIVIGVLATATALDGDPALALCKALVVVIATVVVPVACLLMMGMLGADSEDSTIDPLTGLINRRGLARAVPGLVRGRPAHPDHVVGVLVIDLDKFKWVNDTLGHDVGDLVLAETARRLDGATGGHALTCRTGGEEFVVVTSTAVDALLDLAETIRAAVVTPNQGLRVSASIGAAWTAVGERVARSDALLTVQQLTRSADRAMYEAKRAGGDQVGVNPPMADTTIPDAWDRPAV